MKKNLLMFLGTCFCLNVIAQNAKIEKPDYKKIESVTSDKNSELFYPKLFGRYNRSDTTLTKEDFKFIYYGFLFQPSYSSYGNSNYSDSLKRYFDKESLSSNDYDSLIKYERLVLIDCPFNLRDLNTLEYAYQKKGKNDSAKLIDFKLNSLISTILATGDGKTESTGWHVISVGHEYDILDVLGFKFGGEQSLVNRCDYLKVEKNQYGIKGVYFDVDKLLEAESKLFQK